MDEFLKKKNNKHWLLLLFYLPWIILDSWKSNTSINSYVQLALVDFWSQILASHFIFNHRVYAKQMDEIISCRFSSFCIRDVTSRGMLPTPYALRPNTCNSCFEANLTKFGFRNGGHCSVIITSLSHSHCDLAWTRLTTFWSFRLCTAMAFPNMWTFILAWSQCRGPPLEVENLPNLVFFATKPCTSFKCLINNHLAQYTTMQMSTLHFHFELTFVHFLSFRTILGGQGGVNG